MSGRSWLENAFAAQKRQVSVELPTIYLDTEGDLRLRVGSETRDVTQDFVVCSRTMGRSSTVWKAMLFGGFKESRPAEGEWVVSLPEERPKALLTVLNIIHGRFTEVPTTPSLEQLYLILVLTHKYDMVQQVQPWAAPWSSLVTLLVKERIDRTQLLFVAWELGQEKVFRDLVDGLVIVCSTDSKGRLITPDGCRLDDLDHLGPHDLTEIVSDIRSTTIQSLLDLVDEFIRSLTYELHCVRHKPLSRHSEVRRTCDSVILGSFWKSTIKARGALFPSSVADARDSIVQLSVQMVGALGDIICDERHKECNSAPRVQQQVVETVERRESAVTPDYLKYMKERRKTLGLDDVTNKEGQQASSD